MNVDLALQEIEHLSAAQVNTIVDRAVARYSQDVPQRKALRVTGDGSYRYTLPSDWDSNFSYIELIEYPDREQNITKMRTIDWLIHDSGDGNGEKIHLRDISPSTSDTFTVHYVIQHAVTETSSTISDSDFDAVGYLVASRVCLALAGRALRTRDSRHTTDITNFRTISDEYRSMAKDYYDQYKQIIGLPEKGILPANVVSDIDVTPPWIIGGYLTHGRR